MDAALADNIRRKGSRFREKDLNVDDEYDFDGGIEMYESRNKKGTKVRAARSFCGHCKRLLKRGIDHCCFMLCAITTAAAGVDLVQLFAICAVSFARVTHCSRVIHANRLARSCVGVVLSF